MLKDYAHAQIERRFAYNLVPYYKTAVLTNRGNTTEIVLLSHSYALRMFTFGNELQLKAFSNYIVVVIITEKLPASTLPCGYN